MKIIFSHPTGNENVRAAISGFNEADILFEFHTSIATFPGSFLHKLASNGLFSEMKRRSFETNLRYLTQTHPYKELGRLLALKAGLSGLTKHESGMFSIDAIYHSLDRYTSRQLIRGEAKGAKAIYCYEDGALYSFEKANSLNIKCIYDLPIGYWRAARRLLENEKLIRPPWASTLIGFNDSPKKLARKDKELELADTIFVASTFTAETLKDYPGKLASIQVIPYGFPQVSSAKSYNYDTKRPLKLLFVGGLSQRKGLAQLFEAVQEIGNEVELTIIGNKTGTQCQALDKELEKHHWIPSLPHKEILNQMHSHDVFVFPSLFEGFGLVITEAMSQGTPVITTERTAGPDIIDHGSNGWLVEAGCTKALQSAIEHLIEYPDLIEKVGLAAMETARKRPWEVYGKEMVRALLEIVEFNN